MNLHDLNIDAHWTLFLDRDGVINRRRMGDYVKCREEFEFLPGVLPAISGLTAVFGTLIIVSNQQGIAKGALSHDAIREIHSHMLAAIRKAGGEIHGVYYSPYLDSSNHPWRKPNTGMALQAREDFPWIDFPRSVMIGDTKSDMEFGRRLGMVNVLINVRRAQAMLEQGLYDFRFKDLSSFFREIENAKFGSR